MAALLAARADPTHRTEQSVVYNRADESLTEFATRDPNEVSHTVLPTAADPGDGDSRRRGRVRRRGDCGALGRFC